MKNSKILKIILFVSGVVFVIAGSGTLFMPITFSANHGVILQEDISLLNDIRGSGGLMLGSGIIILLGVIHSGMTFTSTVVSAVIYTTFALSRIMAIAWDGTPESGLIKATIVELILGLTSVFALIKYRSSHSKKSLTKI